MNYKFAKLAADHTPIYAPDAVTIGVQTYLHPTATEYAVASDGPYWPYIDEPPVEPAPDGYHYAPTGWEERAETANPYTATIRRVYNLVADPLPMLADFDEAMEEHLRREREERGYTTREPDSYLTSAVPRWSQDAMDWVAHRDAVMGYALALINAVQAGEREPPTMAEFVAGLPQIEWTYSEES